MDGDTTNHHLEMITETDLPKGSDSRWRGCRDEEAMTCSMGSRDWEKVRENGNREMRPEHWPS